jgi:hypothetical protein
MSITNTRYMRNAFQEGGRWRTLSSHLVVAGVDETAPYFAAAGGGGGGGRRGDEDDRPRPRRT